MKNISFFKYMLKNGLIPLGIITLIFLTVWIINPDPDYTFFGVWLVFIWSIMTFFNYIIWKTNIRDLFVAMKKFFNKNNG
jgi:hypothetical protein